MRSGVVDVLIASVQKILLAAQDHCTTVLSNLHRAKNRTNLKVGVNSTVINSLSMRLERGHETQIYYC